MGWSIIIYGGLTYLIVKQKQYSLISGFSKRSNEEKEYLLEQGYMDALKKLLVTTFWLFFISVLLYWLSIPLGFETGIVIFLMYLLIGMIWIQRYEVPAKRKKMYWITGSIAIVISIGMLFLTYIGWSENDFRVDNDTFVVSGLYGVKWSFDEIEEVQLLSELPEVEMKTNGFAMGSRLKGHFHLESPYETGLLFIHAHHPPYLLIKTADMYLIANTTNSQETEEIFRTLTEELAN